MPNVTPASTIVAPGGHSPAAAVPPELLCRAAQYLPYLDAWNAANVSRRWRETLLADPCLWTHIAVRLTPTASSAWLPTISALIARCGDRPLTIELQYEEQVLNIASPLYGALDAVAQFLAGQMWRMRSLSLSIPTCATPGWKALLRQRAPLLEVLRVFNTTYRDESRQLPSRLFDGFAPRLRTLCLEQGDFPSDMDGVSGGALRGVSKLMFHSSGMLEYGDLPEELETAMPDLRELTCTVFEEYGEIGECALAVDLRVNVADGVEELVAGFPHARSVLYSYAGGMGDDMLDIVERAVLAKGRVASLEIAWTPVCANVFWLAPREPTRRPSLAVNGCPVVVDITLDLLREAMKPRLVSRIARTVHTLAVVDDLWGMFSAVDMPELRDLTVYLRSWDDWPANSAVGDAGKYAVEVLRLVYAPEFAEESDLDLPSSSVVSFIRSIVGARTLPVLHLCGIGIFGHVGAVFEAADRVVYESIPEPKAVNFWSWELADNKVVTV